MVLCGLLPNIFSMKLVDFDNFFIEVYSLWCDLWDIITGVDDGLALN